MSLVQRLLRFILPRDLFEKIESESKQWRLSCPSCYSGTSSWDLGGMRAFASSRGKRIFLKCNQCSSRGMFEVTRESIELFLSLL